MSKTLASDSPPASAAAELQGLLERLRQTAELDLRHAQSLPADAYLSPAFFELEKQTIFRKCWIPLAHRSQFAAPGDYINAELLGEPIVLIRGRGGAIKVLSRVCRHRGMDIIPPEFGRPQTGHVSALRCPYHFWSYDLDGGLIGSPLMDEAADFDKSKVCLHSFRHMEWLGFVWATFDETLAPVNEVYGLLSERLKSWDVAEMKAVVDVDWSCDFNWKLLIDNFMEPYHHLGAHSRIFQPMLPSAGCWTEDEQTNFLVGHLPYAGRLQDQVTAGEQGPNTLPEVPGLLPQDQLEWQVYCGLPFFMLITAPDKVYWYRILPVGPGKMELKTVILVDPSALELPDLAEKIASEKALLLEFHGEDMEMCTAVQRGVASETYRQGRLSHLEKPVWLFQQYLSRVLTAN